MSSLFSHDNSSIGSISTSDIKDVEYVFNFRQPLLLVYLIYTIPSFVAYYKWRKFLSTERVASSYFTLIFSNDFYINVALFTIDLLFTRLPISGILLNLPGYVPEGIILTIIYFLSYYFIYANFYSITLICINRMTSVVFPYAYHSFWQEFVKPAIALVYILPLITTWHMFTYRPYFLPLYENQSSYQLIYRSTILLGLVPRNSTALCFVSILLSVVCVGANCLTIYKYRKTTQTVMASIAGRQNALQRERKREIEITMFIIALVVCLSLVLQALLQALIMIYSSTSQVIRETCQDLRAFALDLAICCPPWILYYNTVHLNKTAISTSSTPHSGAGKKNFVISTKK